MSALLDVAETATLESLNPEQLDHVSLGLTHCFECTLEKAGDGYELRGGGLSVTLSGRLVTVWEAWKIAEQMAS